LASHDLGTNQPIYVGPSIPWMLGCLASIASSCSDPIHGARVPLLDEQLFLGSFPILVLALGASEVLSGCRLAALEVLLRSPACFLGAGSALEISNSGGKINCTVVAGPPIPKTSAATGTMFSATPRLGSRYLEGPRILPAGRGSNAPHGCVIG
jgi:hypothetical protein